MALRLVLSLGFITAFVGFVCMLWTEVQRIIPKTIFSFKKAYFPLVIVRTSKLMLVESL